MIAGLCMLKLYQARHPDINASAYSAYASFAAVITLTVLGVVGRSLSASVWPWRRVPFVGGRGFAVCVSLWGFGCVDLVLFMALWLGY